MPTLIPNIGGGCRRDQASVTLLVSAPDQQKLVKEMRTMNESLARSLLSGVFVWIVILTLMGTF